ncbi:hypothetical protein [Planctobacterium marinum]|uniref:Uncharacterized protein n=1 Tax=Planctobacterium marinum TaxID=1631968 RepID=A0AA48HJ19_9ALTE|nr:hypothetical protein MACH26_33140 [Planctobacterium marinum]
MAVPAKILIIRMLGLGDVTCIGIPAIRYIKSKYPEADISVLTFSAGADVIQLAEPDVSIIKMEKDEWPDNIIHAMERFLMLAEKIIGHEYEKIINLDTWFMPCFLARFLKDAGENLQGNFMSIPVAELIDQLDKQTLQHDYVHNPANYMQSTFFGMARWHTPWWEYGTVPDFGYPEFYLRQCCGFSDIEMNMQIETESSHKLDKIGNKQKVIALATEARTSERSYAYGKDLQKLLEKAGFYVWSGFDGSQPMRKTLNMLKSTDLLITVPSAPQWLATTVDCPCLVIVGEVDARTLMPDYATEPSKTPIPAAELVESVKSIFEEAG